MGLTREIAEFVSEATYDSLPDALVNEAKRILLETIAVTVLGSKSKLGKTIAEVLGQVDESPVAMRIGIGDRCSLRTSAFYNTAIADCNDSAGGFYKAVVHPGKNVAPASLTVASAMEKSGRDMILAMILGIECYFRLDLAIALPHSARGHYNDGTLQ